MVYFKIAPYFLRASLPSSLVWRIKTKAKQVFLTFDDGPVPGVTPWVLEVLDQHNVKATFFCVGENVQKYPEIFNTLVEKGHRVGNHTHNHLNGWDTLLEEYIDNIEKCNELVSSSLFRPPYGKITRKQVKALSLNYSVIMWSVLSGDFDPNLTAEKCLEIAVRNTGKGTIVVFHDSVKALPRLQYALPRYIEYYKSKGFEFKVL
jgi:peptidoglycan-N-acetylglucosamine deacetylase